MKYWYYLTLSPIIPNIYEKFKLSHWSHIISYFPILTHIFIKTHIILVFPDYPRYLNNFRSLIFLTRFFIIFFQMTKKQGKKILPIKISDDSSSSLSLCSEATLLKSNINVCLLVFRIKKDEEVKSIVTQFELVWWLLIFSINF